jgi:hypothetical protein
MLVLVEAKLVGGASNNAAVESEGELFLRDISASGYGAVTRLRGRVVVEADAGEFTSRDPERLHGTGAQSLGLTIEDAPEISWPKAIEWTSVTRYGAQPNDGEDDTAGIQEALASASHVYFPYGQYQISAPIAVTATTQTMLGMESSILMAGDLLDPNATSSVFTIAEAADAPLWLTRFDFESPEGSELMPGRTLINHSSARALVLDKLSSQLRNWTGLYASSPSAGKLFIQNVHAGRVEVALQQSAWLRAVNFELDSPMINNQGGHVWILGFKSWSHNTAIRTFRGKTELLGGFLLPFAAGEPGVPAFVVEDGEVSLVFATIVEDGSDYVEHVAETRAGNAMTLEPGASRVLGSGSYVPLFIGHDRDARVCNTVE